MQAVLQRVTSAAVSVDGRVVGSCGKGFFILLGVLEGDEKRDAELLAGKIAKLRVFKDENDKMNLSVNDIGGSLLIVSQFTLCANYVHGNRPDFLSAAKPDYANGMYEYFTSLMRNLVSGTVETGVFGADMKIESHLDGPVTIIMDSNKLKKDKV